MSKANGWLLCQPLSNKTLKIIKLPHCQPQSLTNCILILYFYAHSSKQRGVSKRSISVPPRTHSLLFVLEQGAAAVPSPRGAEMLLFSHSSCTTKGVCQPLHNGRVCCCFLEEASSGAAASGPGVLAPCSWAANAWHRHLIFSSPRRCWCPFLIFFLTKQWDGKGFRLVGFWGACCLLPPARGGCVGRGQALSAARLLLSRGRVPGPAEPPRGWEPGSGCSPRLC